MEKAKENDSANFESQLMDLAKDGSITPAEKEASTIPGKPTDQQQKGTPKPDRPATRSSKSHSSDEDDSTDDEEHQNSFLEWLSLGPECNKMLDNKTKMLVQHERKMGNKAVSILQQAVHEDPK